MAKLCPRCLNNALEVKEVLNALSRTDNKTYVCSPCGTEEAFHRENLRSQEYWNFTLLQQWVELESKSMIGQDDRVEILGLRIIPANTALDGAKCDVDTDGEGFPTAAIWDRFNNNPMENATHYIRFYIKWEHIELLDAEDWWINVNDRGIELLTEVDHPALQGATEEECQKWVGEVDGW